MAVMSADEGRTFAMGGLREGGFYSLGERAGGKRERNVT